MSNQAMMEEMIRRITQLEEAQRRMEGVKPLYTILNMSSPAQITANQNDYDPGYVDVLRLSTDASRNISGFSGGQEGRILHVRNRGSNNIVLLNDSVLSLAGNRIFNPGATNVTMQPISAGLGSGTCVLLIYQDPYWIIHNVYK